MADDIRTYVSANNTDDISSNAIRTYVVVLNSMSRSYITHVGG